MDTSERLSEKQQSVFRVPRLERFMEPFVASLGRRERAERLEVDTSSTRHRVDRDRCA